jgi:hypothetical protein
MRLKYGFLLKVYLYNLSHKILNNVGVENFTESNTIPVFRTESQYVTRIDMESNY